MSKIVFTYRELERAWKNNYSAYENLKNIKKNTKTNTHRLMLFYAIECGLKAFFMKREKKQVTDLTITELGHNINKMLDKVKAGKSLKLPSQIRLKPLRNDEQRICDVENINQIWRYGHLFPSSKNDNFSENDQTIENKLLKIYDWIQKELSGVKKI